MTPIIHFSVGNISVLPMSTIIPRQEIRLTRCSLQGKYAMLVSSSRSFLLPQSSLQLVQIYRKSCYVKPGSRYRIVAAVESDVTIEEPNFATSEETDEVTEIPDSIGTSEPAGGNPVVTSNSKNRGKRPRNVRKSEMPPVKNEELVPGASFMGKVVSIQPFGAFVDFGAYTDGLVHVSRLSDGFVKDVGSLVSIGQEVKVRIVEVNMESGRISLTMRDGDDANKSQQRKDAPSSGISDKPRPARRNATRSAQKGDEVQKSSKFVKGQVLDGTVKNITRSGAFVSLPEGEEGFLPVSEEYEGFGNLSGNTSLQVGQQVNVRVLRITRGQVTLTMKKEEDVEGLNMQLNQGVVHVATNPFELAFRKNKEIAAFLDEREKAQKASETSEEIGEKVDEIIMKYSTPGVGECTTTNHSDEIGVPFASGVELEVEEITSNELPSKVSVMDSILTEPDEELMSISTKSVDGSIEPLPKEESSESSIRSSVDLSLTEVSVREDEVNTDEEPGNMLSESPAADSVLEAPLLDKAEHFGVESETIEEAVITSKSSISKEDEPSANVSSVSSITGSASATNEGLETGKDDKILEGTEGILTSESSVIDEDLKADGLKDANITAGAVSEDAVGSGTSSEIVNGASTDCITGEGPVRVDVTPEEVNGDQVCDSIVDANVESQTTSLGNEIASADSEEAKVEVSEAPNEESGIAAPERTIKGTISAALVKQLREETGAGMMDCKKALAETGGDIVKAQEFLRKKGLASADKKASRATAEGRIGSYIHDNRIGVLIEVNCETDFVSRGEIFKELVDDLTMQVAACPQVQYLVTDDVPEEIVNKEREIEMQKEDLLTKPEQIRSKIVDGRIRKRLEEFALLEQPYIKNDKVVVKDLVKQTIATIGENIKIKRFVRYNLGEGLEKKTQDFAAEVAAQTAARSTAPAVPKDQSAESKATVEKQPTVVVSAALVKQLREETGAGMMDCKKALTETGGDLEKGLEYLRKKGLSSAEKTSSRLAAEGRIGAYIHDSRIGTLIEVNCETDFVGRSEKFKELVDDLSMQVVACPQVEFVSVEEIPESIVNKEKEIEMHREDLQSKPENIREKIVEGRISKTLGELALLEQPYIKDDSIKVKDLVKQTVAALGENIKVRRFVRFTLGEKKD